MSRDISVAPTQSKGAPKGGEQAYERLRELIVSLELPPNESIDEKGLTVKLGLGRTPVREALIRLALENLVVIYPRRGTYVAPLDLESLRDLEQLRFNLEAFASSLAARHADARDLSALRALVDEARISAGGAGSAWRSTGAFTNSSRRARRTAI